MKLLGNTYRNNSSNVAKARGKSKRHELNISRWNFSRDAGEIEKLLKSSAETGQ